MASLTDRYETHSTCTGSCDIRGGITHAKHDVEEEEEENQVSSSSIDNLDSNKPRRWLVDRCDGTEQVMNPDSRPCCPIFFAPLFLKFFPDWLEQNKVMECLGKIGLVSARNIRARQVIMTVALLSTLLGWAFLIVADLSISKTNYHHIEMASFNYSSIAIHRNYYNHNYNNSNLPWDLQEQNGGQNLTSTRISLGLRAAGLATSSFERFAHRQEQTNVVPFEQFCDNQDKQQGDNKSSLLSSAARSIASRIVFVDPDKCHQCSDASRAMVSSILLSTVTYFFTFTTDVLRIWPNYDVNCQKVFGAFFALFSTIMGIRTWFLYRHECYASFATGWTCFDDAFQAVDCGAGNNILYDNLHGRFYVDNPHVAYLVYTHWQIGPGLICLGVATFAKVLDLLCNFVIPTPSITRNQDEQWEYERAVLLVKEEQPTKDEDVGNEEEEEEQKTAGDEEDQRIKAEPTGETAETIIEA